MVHQTFKIHLNNIHRPKLNDLMKVYIKKKIRILNQGRIQLLSIVLLLMFE